MKNRRQAGSGLAGSAMEDVVADASSVVDSAVVGSAAEDFGADLTIGQVAERTGLRTSAIRYYEEAGVLPTPRRVNGRRRYRRETIRVIEVLKFAQAAGFTLDEVRTLFHGFGGETHLNDRWEALAVSKLRELDDVIARAEQMKRAIRRGLACGCVRAEDCVLDGEATGA